jgi:hypothetical protein
VINPLRSEEDAFRFTVIVAVLVAPVALTAIIFSTVAALVVAGAIAVAVTVWLVLTRPQQEQEQELMALGRRTADGEPHRILVVANETLTGEALRAEIAHRTRGRAAEVMVVCPALNTKLKTWVSDEDEARVQAHDRLDTMLGQLRAQGIDASGDIGDGDPMLAMEDALRQFPADEMIISTHPHGRSNWLEHDLVQHARERFPIPISHVVVDLAHERAAAGGRAQGEGITGSSGSA